MSTLTCSIKNPKTGEPKPFFQVGNEFFRDYKSALESSVEGQGMVVGFVNTQDVYEAENLFDFNIAQNDYVVFENSTKIKDTAFIKVAELPITFNKTTKEGMTNHLIKEGLVQGEVGLTSKGNKVMISEGFSEIVARQNAIDVHNELRSVSEPHGYIKRGDTFELTDTFGKIKVGDNFYTREEILTMDTNEPAILLIQERHKLNNRPKKTVTTKDTNESLKSALVSFLNSMGFSIESIETYKKKYNLKYKVNPDAKALLDISNQVIAFREAEIGIDELKEETAHLIIEGWNQQEISKLLREIDKTQEWVEHAEAYRKVYSEMYSTEEEVDQAVRREILGKFLSNRLKNNEASTDIETNIFNYALDVLSKFLNRIFSNVNKTHVKELEDFTKRVNTLLEAQKLSEAMDTDTLLNSNYSVMYKIDKDSDFYNIYTQINKVLEKVQDNYQVLNENMLSAKDLELKAERLARVMKEIEESSEEVDIAVAYRSITALFGIVETKLRELETSLSLLEEGQAPSLFDMTLYELISNNLYRPLTIIKNEIEQSKTATNRFKIPMNEIFNKINKITGIIELKKKDADEELLKRVEERGGTEARDEVEQILNQEQRDHSFFYKMFGQMLFSKIPQMAAIGKIVSDMYALARVNYVSTVRPFLDKLAASHQGLHKLIKGRYYKSHRNFDEIENRTKRVKAETVKEILNLDTSLEELEKINWNTEELLDYIKDNKINVDPIKIKLRYNRVLDRKIFELSITNKNSEAYKRKKAEFELMDQLNISDEAYEIIRAQRQARARIRAKMGINTDLSAPENKTYKSSLQRLKAVKTEYKDPFQDAYDLHEGLYFVNEEDYDAFNPDMVRIDSRTVIRIDRDVATENARVAFDLNKLDKNALERRDQAIQLLQKDPNSDISVTGYSIENGKLVDNRSLYKKGDPTGLKERALAYFNEQYDLELSKGLRPHQARVNANKRTFEWFFSIANFGYTQDYWDSLQGVGSLSQSVEDLLKQNPNVNPTTYQSFLKFIEYGKRGMSRVLKKYQDTFDYKEIAVEEMSSIDLEIYTMFEGQVKHYTKVLIGLLKEEGLELPQRPDTGGERELNNAFHREFQEYSGKPLDYYNYSKMVEFMRTKMSSEDLTHFNKFSNALLEYVKGTSKSLGKAYKRIVDDLGIPADTAHMNEILMEYGKTKMPSYYYRYSPKGYKDMLQAMRVDIQSFLQSPAFDELVDGTLPNFEISVSQTLQDVESSKYVQSLDLYKEKLEEAKNLQDKRERLLKSYEAFLHISGMDDINYDDSTYDREFLNQFGMSIDQDGNLTAPTKNLEEFENLLLLLEMRAKSLELYGQIGRTSVFKFANFRRSNLERISFNPKEGVKYVIEDWIKYREDEEESFMRSEARRIPKLGFTELPIEDMSTNMLHVAAFDLYNANLYNQRVTSLNSALALQDSLSRVKFKGKHAKETGAWEMTTGYIDASFYGKQTTARWTVDILGKQIDFAKVLSTFRSFVQTNALGFSVPVALTSLTTASTNKLIQRGVKFHLYDAASSKADVEFAKLASGSIKDMGKIYSDAKLDKIMQFFGNYDVTERLANSSFGYGTRNISNLNKMAFAVHQMANFPVIPRIVLSKLMEYRLIDGKFMSWSNFKTLQKSITPSISNGEIEAMFDSHEDKAIYNYLDLDKGVFNEEKLKEIGFSGDTKQLFVDIASDISYNVSQYDGMVDQSQRVEAQRHPILSFLMMFKGWMSIVSSRNFAPKYFNHQTGNVEEGIMITLGKTINDVAKNGMKGGFIKEARKTYASLSPAQKANLRSLGFTQTAVLAFLALAGVLIAWADVDDDDEEKNYLLELATLVTVRTLNETFNSSVGIGSEYFNMIEAPVSSSATIKAAFDILNVSKVNKQVTRGAYEGWNKYTADLFKMSFAKNFYTMSAADNIFASRSGYVYFGEQALYTPLTIVQWLSKKDK